MPFNGEENIIIFGDQQYSLSQIDESARCFARQLGDARLGKGDRLGLLLYNDITYFIAMRAAAYLGLNLVPLNWHFTPEEIAYILDDSRAKALIGHAGLLSNPVRSVIGDRTLIVASTPAAVIEAYRLDPSTCSPTADDVVLAGTTEVNILTQQMVLTERSPLFYTSGTTGQPKGIDYGFGSDPEASAHMLKANAKAWNMHERGFHAYLTAPMYHSAPFAYANMVVNSMESTLILEPRFDAELMLRNVERYGVTHIYAIPTMFIRLLKLAPETKSRYDLSTLQSMSHGAAPCPADIKREMIEWLGPVIDEFYAMTETGVITAISSEEWLAHPGSVGRPVDGVEVKISDADGKPRALREAGEICVRNPFSEKVRYENAPEKTEKLHRDEYILTGEIGYLDEEQYLYISDRHSDLVISGGVNIYPSEVEAVLAGMPQVVDSVVFGIPDYDLGEKLAAIVESEDEISQEAVQSYLLSRIAKFKVPAVIRFVDKLQRDPSGKIKKRKLRQWILEEIKKV